MVEKKMEVSELYRRIRQARGQEPADLVLKGCRIVDVFSGSIMDGDIAICGEEIVGIGAYSGRREIDCRGCHVCPGFMEGHIHIESSMLSPRRFVETVLPHGTTAVVCDPHEIANVAGIEGIRYMLEESEGLGCGVFVMAPSCVPATHLENSGAVLTAADLEGLLDLPRVIGLAEMMNFPGVLAGDQEVLAKLAVAHGAGLPVDGHAPGLSGADLQAYVGAGIGSDHECTTAAEAEEKLAAGMYIFIREGSTARNLENLLPVVNPGTNRRCLLVTDDCHPGELLKEGHLDRILRRAIGLGLDPVTAIRMVSLNVAEYFRLHNRGAVAPGYRADLVLLEDLHEIRIRGMVVAGRVLDADHAVDTAGTTAINAKKYPRVFGSVHVRTKALSFAIPAAGEIGRVIGIQPRELLTDALELPLKIENGLTVADVERDIVKVAVVERHRATGNVGLGFVRGIGLKHGALASTVGHDSHNITVLGVNDDDMARAVEALAEQGGGLVAVRDGEVLSRLVLEVGGLMTAESARHTAANFSTLLETAAHLGVQVEDPFMIMSFLALPVIPHLKITDQGLVDVDAFCHVDLWVR